MPAHIWTPWFSALGSKSGFDAIADCYADLAEHIFAVETGLSSDPEMNWRVVQPGPLPARLQLGRALAAGAGPRGDRASTADLDYFAVREALRTGDGLAGTIEFFPEEGKYHADGHRRLRGQLGSPAQTRAAGGRCPECGKPLTVGVLSRVEELADRPGGRRPPHAQQVTHLVQLAEILGEINGVGPEVQDGRGPAQRRWSPRSARSWTSSPARRWTRSAGSAASCSPRRSAGCAAARCAGSPGYDGEYGVITLFEPGELAATGGGGAGGALFDVPAPGSERRAAEPAGDGRRPASRRGGDRPSRSGRPAPGRRRPPAHRRSPRRRRRTSRSSRCSPAWRRSAPACWTGSTRCSGWPPPRRAGRC